MSTQYNGNAANTFGSLPSSLSINSSTNSTPIIVTTNLAHGLVSGDSVVIGGHLVNTAANGRWIVTVLTPLTFSLAKISGANSVGIGSGLTTGTVYPVTMGATYPDPSDGDNDNAASVDVAFQALGDRSAYLGRQVAVGAYQPALVQAQSLADTDPPGFGALGVITGSVAGAAWQQFKISGSEKVWTIPNLCQGDVVSLDFTTSAQQNFNVNALVTFWIQQVSAGGSLSAPVRLGGAGQIVPWSGANPSPLHLKGVATMGAFNGDPGGSLLVVVRAYMPNNATDTITFFSEAELAYTIMRPNA